MNKKSLRRQLILTVFVLAIAFFSLSGATFAWFSMNDQVEATGLKMVAETEGVNFEITGETEADGTIPKFSDGKVTESKVFSATELLPTHPDIAVDKSFEWKHAFSEEYDDAAVDATQDKLTTSLVGDIVTADAKAYALKATYYVRLNPTTTDDTVFIRNVKATNVIVSGSKEYTACTRLLVVGPDGTYEIGAAGCAGDGIDATTSGVLINSVVKGVSNYYPIDVYAFFEGTDTHCTSEKYEMEDVRISVDFVGETVVTS